MTSEFAVCYSIVFLAVYVMACGWVLSFTLAVLPLVGVSSYQTVVYCLPIDVADTKSLGKK